MEIATLWNLKSSGTIISMRPYVQSFMFLFYPSIASRGIRVDKQLLSMIIKL